MLDRIPVLDSVMGTPGSIELVDWLGSDLTPLNAAKASYEKRSYEMNKRGKRLLTYLSEHGHTSPFRHAIVQFEIKAPLLVARQWEKHRVGAALQYGADPEARERVEIDDIEPVEVSLPMDQMHAWNESSRRYVTSEPEFWIPDEWRSAPDNAKQGSGDPVDPMTGLTFTAALTEHIERSTALYASAMESGICAEQARLFLPAYALHVRWYWTASLEAVLHFIHLREAHDAQVEIQQYAVAIRSLTEQVYPLSVEAFDKARDKRVKQAERIAELEAQVQALYDLVNAHGITVGD